MSALRVAYVEDNQSNLIPVLRKMRDAGLEVQHFYTIGGATNGVSEGHIDAVVVSIDMPGFKRTESLDLFATQFPSVPLIVMAAQDDLRNIRQELGPIVSDYFIKDECAVQELAQMVAEKVERARNAPSQ